MTASINHIDYIEKSALKEYTFSAILGDWVYGNDTTIFSPVDKNNNTYKNSLIGIHDRVASTETSMDADTFLKIFNSTIILSIRYEWFNNSTETFANRKTESDIKYSIMFTGYPHSSMINSSQSYLQLSMNKADNMVSVTFGVININGDYYVNLPGSTITFIVKCIQF